MKKSYKPKTYLSLYLIIIFTCFGFLANAQTFYLKSSLISPIDASDLSNYTSDMAGGAGSTPADFNVTAGQTFNLRNNTGATVTMLANITLELTSKFVVGDGTNAIAFTIPTGRIFTGRMDVSHPATAIIDGTFDNNQAGTSGLITSATANSNTLTVNGTHTISGTSTATVFSRSSNTTVGTIFYASTSNTNITASLTTANPFSTYQTGTTLIDHVVQMGNVTFNPSSLPSNGGSFLIATNAAYATFITKGNLAIENTGADSLHLTSGTGNRSYNIAGNFIINGGVVIGVPSMGGNNTGSATINLTGNFEMNGGVFDLNTAVATNSSNTGQGRLFLNITGNFLHTTAGVMKCSAVPNAVNNIGTFNLAHNGMCAVLTFNGTTPQTFSTIGITSPSASRILLIYSGTNTLTLSGTMPTFRNFSVTNAAGTIALGSNNITVQNLFANIGTITSTTGSITINATPSQLTPFNSFITGTAISITEPNITFNNTNGVTINTSNFLRALGVVTVNTGVTVTTNTGLILGSNASKTGSLATVAGTITGDVTVQRFVPAKAARRWSFVSSPISTLISTSWQTNTHITGAGTGGTACPTLTTNDNGFDRTETNAASMFVYNGTATAGSRWVALANTNATDLTPGVGYRMNIRGPRATGCALLDGTPSGLVPAATTLSATGAITNGVNSGNVSVTVNSEGTVNNGYVLIGNPYPAVIDFNAFRVSNSALIANEYKTYSPANAAGTYTTWNGGSLTNAGDLTNGQYIASGQAFFVQKLAAGAANLSFAEAHKATQTQVGTFRTSNSWNNIVRVGMKTTTDAHLDEIIIRFANEADVNNTSLGSLDAISINEGAQKITSVKAKSNLAIQTRSANFTTDMVDLNVNSTTTGSYKLLFTEFENFTGATIYLIDNYTNTTQKVNDNPVYSFDINTAIPATQAAGRFSVQFVKAITPQAIVIAGIKMYPNPASKNVTIELPITEGKYTVRVTDIAGKQVYQNQLAGGVQNLNLGKLQQGNYVVEITDSKGNRSVEKLVKQ